MNTHDKLPPLPDPYGYFDNAAPGWSNSQVRDAQRAAIEADRKHTAGLISAYQGRVRALEAENHSLVSDLDDRQARGEPVAWEFSHNGYWTRTSEPEMHKQMGREVRPLFTAPQPSQQPRGEPVKDRRIDDVISELTHGSVALGADQEWISIRRHVRDSVINRLKEISNDRAPQIPDGYRLQPISEFDAMMDARMIPEGYKLVPIEPTQEMMRAGCQVPLNKAACHNLIYKAMLEAAPEVRR